MSDASAIAAIARQLYWGISGSGATLQTLRPYICPFEEILPLVPEGAYVLDAGCGAGLFLGLLAHSGRVSRGFGFDANDTAIGLAQRMVTNLPPGVQIDFQRLDATAAWPKGAFDVVSLVDVLHHVPPEFQLHVLSLAISRVRIGGLLLYKDMAMRPRWKALCNRVHDLLAARQWIHYLPFEGAERHLTSNGMTVLVRRSASRFWYAHEWVLLQRSK